jgi:hypothetical protein
MEPLRIGVLGAARISGLAIAGTARCNMAGDRDRWPFRVVGTRGEATAANFVQPHLDDRVLISTEAGDRVEELGRRSSYTYQLEALRAHLRDGTPLPVGPDDAVDTMALIDACYQGAGFAPAPALRVEPPDLVAVAVLALVVSQKLVQHVDESTDGVEAPRHAPVGGEQQALVAAGLQRRTGGERHEVPDVVGHDRALLLRHPTEELVVAEPDEIGTFGHRDDVMASGAELPGDLGGVVLVEQQPHASASPRRRQRSSSRSATACARSIHSSISSP